MPTLLSWESSSGFGKQEVRRPFTAAQKAIVAEFKDGACIEALARSTGRARFAIEDLIRRWMVRRERRE